MNEDDGFSMVELLVSLVLMLTLLSAAMSVATTNVSTAGVAPETADLQQRARAAADMIARDLYMAGAGVNLGPASGPLGMYFATIVPRRMGLQQPDPYTVARNDAITIVFVPATQSQTTIRQAIPSGGTDLRVDALANCPPGDLVCGFTPGTSLAVFDRDGVFDFFTLLQVQADLGRLRSWQVAHPSHAYSIGSVVAVVEAHTYYFDIQNRQLRHFDGYLTDTPVVDEVVGLTFEYWGDPVSPSSPRPLNGTANCLYDTAGAPIGGTVLPTQGATLAALPLAMFTDGPWCGDGENRFDADLLRIRRVRVRLRLQVPNDMLRGQTADFAHGGRSRSASRRVPDYTVSVDVTPRNLAEIR